jgi:uncharacterized LabA/DUF88 family protein
MPQNAPSPTARLAVLIDADNAQPSLAEPLFAEIAKYGIASVRRIYGDWMTNNLAGWKKVLVENAIQPIQQVRYTAGKNATDSALIIDAMDLLYTQRFDGFCIVSSDSDFTRLAVRIREAGLTAYGFGERKTPQSFVAACDKFIYVDVLRAAAEPAEEAERSSRRQAPKDLRGDSRLVSLVRNAIDAAQEDDGWAHLGGVGQHIGKQAPEFDSRNWGYRKLSDLVKAIGLFEVTERKRPDGSPAAIFVREKRRSSPSAPKSAD